MNRKIGLVAVVVLLVAVAGAAAVAFGGVADVPTVDGDDGTTGDEATGDETTGDDTGTTATPDMTETDAAFAFGVDEIEECGNTCRDATATVYNDGDGDAADVTVETNIYTDGDLIWEGDESVGALEAGAEHTSTHRIDLSYGDALKVESNDGWITIETIVRFDGGQEVFVEEQQVS